MLKTQATRNLKEDTLTVLKCNLAKSPQSTKRILIELPKAHAHTNHVVIVESGFTHRIHPEVKKKIYDLVEMGFTSVPIIRSERCNMASLFYTSGVMILV